MTQERKATHRVTREATNVTGQTGQGTGALRSGRRLITMNTRVRSDVAAAATQCRLPAIGDCRCKFARAGRRLPQGCGHERYSDAPPIRADFTTLVSSTAQINGDRTRNWPRLFGTTAGQWPGRDRDHHRRRQHATLVSFNDAKIRRGISSPTPPGTCSARPLGGRILGVVFEIAKTSPASPARRPCWSASTAPTGMPAWRPDLRRRRGPLRQDRGGGANGYGVVFEIAKTSTGYASRRPCWSASTAPTEIRLAA